jgi:O-antigen ligase
VTYKNRFIPDGWGTASRLQSATYVFPILASLTAIVIGFAIGEGQWLVGLLALFIPLVLLYPVQVGLGMFAILIPFDSIAVLGEAEKGRTLTWFAGAAAIGILLGVGLAARRLKALPVAAGWWIVFTCWSMVTMLWGLNLKASLEQVPSTLALLGFYLAASSIRYKKNELRAITFLSILGGCAAAAYSAYLFRQGNFYEMGETRASLIVNGRYTNPDGLAMTQLLPISFAFSYFLSYKRWLGKAIMLLVIALTSMGLFLTMSRGAVLGLVAVLFVFVYRVGIGRRLVAPLVLLAIVLCFMPSAFFQRFVEASESGGSGRTNIWKVGLVAFSHYGLIGAGFHNFPFAYTNYVNASSKFEGFDRDSHNIYLAVGVETGIIGLFLFGMALRNQFKTASRIRNHTSAKNLLVATEAAACGLLVYSFFGNILWDKSFWFAWAMLAAAGSVAEDSSEPALEET